MFRTHGFRRLALLGIVLVAVGGCTIDGKRAHRASSVVDFLYPNDDFAIDKPTIPHLDLPLDVGIAFVPSTGGRYSKHDIDGAQQIGLMDRIAAGFAKHDFIGRIEFIPSVYLRAGGSFSNLDHIRTMHHVDVMVLLSYDQVQYVDEDFRSLTYWTIVGAYVVPGEKNDTSTMLDAAVYDIASRKMLFRAPGMSLIEGSATLVNNSEQLRADSREGFARAADNLVVNLTAELDRFQVRVKERPAEYHVTRKPDFTGGGSFGAGFAILFLALAGTAAFHGRGRA